jgi:hypothetical protein
LVGDSIACNSQTLGPERHRVCDSSIRKQSYVGPRWVSCYLFYSPTFVQMVDYRTMIEPKFSSPHADTLCLAKPSSIVVPRTIVGLLERSSPVTVSLVVSLRVISSLDRVFWWTVSHVSMECAEVAEPPLAYFNAPSTISRITYVFGISASLLHTHPDAINAGVPHSMLHVGTLAEV